MKYELERLGPDNFEHLIQSLIRGVAGNSAIFFGNGADGQREAVIENANLMICGDAQAHGRTVVQAKFKGPDTKQGDWDWLRKNLKDELEGFKEKITTHPHIVPETFLFYTNIVLTPVLDSGIRDRAEKFVAEYKDIIPNICIFGADDIRTMLENNRDVARCYASFIMPGDVLMELHENLKANNNENFEALIEYACQMFREDSAVRLEQAGSVSNKSINIHNVYTDLEAKARSGQGREIKQVAAYIIELGNQEQKRTSGIIDGFWKIVPRQKPPSEFDVVLIGNAGQGKSTLCQYICQIYRAALLRRFRRGEPETHYYFIGDAKSNVSIPRCERFPVLINLKRYAAWIKKQGEENGHSVISYILFLINGKVNASLSIHDFRCLLSDYSWVFLFDGLDEVPASSNRSDVLRQIREFVGKDLVESSCDSLAICTSRPQGYDDAFSVFRYNHYELKDMSSTLCKSYIEKLLTYLEDNSDERDRYRKILHNALDDPMISKLMTTPLYTAIIVLLVKMGGTPPTKRYTLFQEYCEIIVKREKQKEMLPSIHDEYDWIVKLHAQIGFQLQAESETAENAAAELSSVCCKQLIVQFLQDEGFDGELSAKSEDLYWAITNRLSFLSEVSGSDQEACVLFPLRSIQEYFAAEWLISFDDEDKLSEALELISVSAYWRNVYLFVAGFFTKHRNRKNMNETLFRICLRNNGDENYDSENAVAYRIAMEGSWLALDLLCDNLFSRPDDQRRYLNVVAKLLDGDYDASLLIQRLPSKIADIFLQEKVIPYIQKTKNAEGFAFMFLWVMANNQNKTAYAQLEELIGDVTVPDAITINKLLSSGFDKVGEKAIRMVYLWITEERFTYFCEPLWAYDEYCNFLSYFFMRSLDTEFSLMALRQAVYRVLLASSNRVNKSNLRSVSYPSRLLQKMVADEHLNELFFPCYTGNLGLTCRPIQHDMAKPCLSEYAKDFRLFQLNELAALAEFLHSPSCLGIRKLLEACRDLPERCKDTFIHLIGQCNWFLQGLADRLLMSESEEKLFAHYDSTYVEACLRKDREMTDFIETTDLVSITRSNYWNEIGLSYETTIPQIPQDLMREILSIANEKTINKGFISFLYATTESEGTIYPELAQFSMHYFPLMFQSIDGVELVLKLFDQISLRSLVYSNIEYPKTIQVSWAYRIEEEQANRILERIDLLAELGEEFLQAYALFPHFFRNTEPKVLLQLRTNTLMQYYHAISATRNQAALLGCILRILAGPVSDEQKTTIWEKLLEALQIGPFVSICYMAVEHFSMDGKVLVYEAITTLATDTKRNSNLFRELEHEILKELEARPVARNELMELSKSAHSDRQFL